MALTHEQKRVREILALRASGWTIYALSIQFGKDRTSIRHHLVKYNVCPMTDVVNVKVDRPKEELPIPAPKPADKYAYLLDEAINTGKSYKEYVALAKEKHPNERWHRIPKGIGKVSDLTIHTYPA